MDVQSRQEERFEEFIKKNINSSAFIDTYLKSGLASDANLNGKLTPEIFKKHFLVSRHSSDEAKFDDIINRLFRDEFHNLLCIQSDGGSGKSVFINSLALRDTTNLDNKYCYEYIHFDLTNRMSAEKNPFGEDLVAQRFRKLYKRISSDGQELPQWRKDFVSRLKFLDMDDLPEDGSYSSEIYRKSLKLAIEELTHKGTIDNWHDSYSTTAHKLDTENLRVLLVLYLLALATQPNSDNIKYIIVFDNIEAYVRRSAEAIADTIQSIYLFIKHIFSEIGSLDQFYGKFTSIFLIRSTTLPYFENFTDQQVPIWGLGQEYIISLNTFDFIPEALLKKIRYLLRFEECRKSVVFRRIKSVLSVIMPVDLIEQCLIDDNFSLAGAEAKLFTANRLMPFFNSNYRKVLDYIFNLIVDDFYSASIETLLSSVENRSCDKTLVANGIHTILFRSIFNNLRKHEILSVFGFEELSGAEDSSLTRVLLDFLYWEEVRNCYEYPNAMGYQGIRLSQLLRTFRYFYHEKTEELSIILYNLSIFSKNDPLKRRAIDAWTHLIVFSGLDIELSRDDIKIIIRAYFNKKTTSNITISGHSINLDNIRVKLSDAGCSFVQYNSRQFEFLLARHKDLSTKSLFSLKSSEIEEIIRTCRHSRQIVTNCITKLIDGSLKICRLCGHYDKNENECGFYQAFNNNEIQSPLISCSLFIRYQECLLLIVDNMDFIDRYRSYIYQCSHSEDLNHKLLLEIKEFNQLFSVLETKVRNSCKDSGECEKFFKMMLRIAGNAPIEEDRGRCKRYPRRSLYYFDYKTEFEKIYLESKKQPSSQLLYDIWQNETISRKQKKVAGRAKVDKI